MAQANTLYNRSALQNNNLAGHYSSKGPNFKTSNPEIFPSLHPLGGFYHHKKATPNPNPNPNPALNQKRELEVTSEPVKKQRLNTGIEQSVLNTEKVNIPVENKKKDDYVFRVPQLPRRLREQNKVSSPKVETSVINAPVNLGTSMSGFEMKESLNYREPVKTNNKKVKSTKNEKAVKAAKTMETVNEVQHETVDQSIDPIFLSALYEKLIFDYYTLQLEQSNQNYLTQLAINNIIRGQNNNMLIL